MEMKSQKSMRLNSETLEDMFFEIDLNALSSQPRSTASGVKFNLDEFLQGMSPFTPGSAEISGIDVSTIRDSDGEESPKKVVRQLDFNSPATPPKVEITPRQEVGSKVAFFTGARPGENGAVDVLTPSFVPSN